MSDFDVSSIIADLTEGTGFQALDEISLMTSRTRIKSPLWVMNCIFGGGIPLGVIVEQSGPPQSGKSTEAYQKAGLFQKMYPNGIVAILDSETSTDSSRMPHLGLDLTTRVLRLPASTLEGGFESLFKLLNKLKQRPKEEREQVPVYIIWDTISTGGTNKQVERAGNGQSVMNAGGMMEAPRILKQNLGTLFNYIEDIPVVVLLLNQVSTQFGAYHSSVGSGGGFGLKHNAHLHFAFKGGNEVWTNEGFYVANITKINIEKNKVTPKFHDIPVWIDVTKGGIIDEFESFMTYLEWKGMVPKSGAWYKVEDFMRDEILSRYPEFESACQPYMKKFYWSKFKEALREDTIMHKILQIWLMDYVNNIYSHMSDVNGSYKLELMSEVQSELNIGEEETDPVGELSEVLGSDDSDTTEESTEE